MTHYRPIQPRLSFDVTQTGMTAHGALITSLVTRPDIAIEPAFARPTVDLAANEPPLRSGDVVFPSQLQTITSYKAPDGPRQNLVLITGQFIPDDDSATTCGSQRLFDSIGVQVTYSQEPDFFAPQVSGATATIQSLSGAGNLVFSLSAKDVNALGATGTVERAVVLYRLTNTESNTWTFLELGQGVQLGSWTAAVTIPATAETRVEWFAQVIDGAGNVTVSANKGAYFFAGEKKAPNTVITNAPGNPSTAGWATFSFRAEGLGASGASFQCSLDLAVFTPCASPATYVRLSIGEHLFKVRAVVNGVADPAPASIAWKVIEFGPPDPENDGRNFVCGPEGTAPYEGHRCRWLPD